MDPAAQGNAGHAGGNADSNDSGRDLDDDHARPEGATDAEIEAAGTVSEALEKIERARGHLYSFHQLIGAADMGFGEGADQLSSIGHDDLATRLREELIGRNVIAGRWSFQLVEDFDDGYWRVARGLDQVVRDTVTHGRRHVYEAEMKQRRRTHGRGGHEAGPQDL